MTILSELPSRRFLVEKMTQRAPVLEAKFEFVLSGNATLSAVEGRVHELLGFGAADFFSSGVCLVERIHPHDACIVAALFDPHIGRPRGEANLRVRHADGRIRCVRAGFEKRKSGGECRLTLVLQDAKSLWGPEPQSAQFRAIVEHTGESLFLKDRNHVFAVASPVFKSILSSHHGLPDPAGLTDYDFLPEHEADSFYELEETVFNDGEERQEIFELQRQRPEWIHIREYPVRSEAGEVIGVLANLREITQHMLVEERPDESTESLRESQQIAGLGSYLLDLRRDVFATTALADTIFGVDPSYPRTIEGWLGLVHPQDLPGVMSDLDEYFVQGKPFDKEYRILRRSDQAVRWIHGLGRVEVDDHGKPLLIRGTVQDITRFKEAEQRLELAASVFHHASEGILVTDLDGTILDVNDTFTRITGYSREEVLGANPRILKSGLQDERFYQEMWREIHENGRWHGELWNRGKNGNLFAVKSTITTVHDAARQPQYYVGLFFDITPIKEQERKLAQIARYDALTGLPNRELFTERLRSAMSVSRQTGQRLAVAYFDLDAFKKINDQRGHEAADALLVSVAGHLKEALREGDTLARVGGDEFVAILADLSGAYTAASVLSRLLEAAAYPFHFGEDVLDVTATAGATVFPQSEDVDADQLMRQAAGAMYEAKLAGKNRFHIFDPWREHSVRGRHEETDQIRRALVEDELVLYYQPVVNMATGEMIGAEALLRWQHPQRGLLAPALFLPAIEDHDLMIEVGEWVIATALDQIAEWAATGFNTRVSVNVSARQLEQPEFIDRLRALLVMHPAVNPSSLELEVLETSALEDVARVSAVVAACRELGMSVAIDDFGTGYSSLTYLKRLPVSILKIDQSFVRDMLDDPDDLTILQGVIGLAGAFRRLAIAEGVETVEHGVLLLKLGCLYAQGYGIARPMPASELPGWFAHWRPDPRWTAVRPTSPVNWPLLVAEVEVRSWDLAFEEFMKGERRLSPELNDGHCRLANWLDAEKHGVRGVLPAFYTLRTQHAQSHALARRVVDSKLAGRDEETGPLLTQFREVRSRMLDTLRLISSWGN